MPGHMQLFKQDLEPYFQPGDRFVLITANTEKVYDVLGVEALPDHRHDFGDLTAGTSSTGNDPIHLDVGPKELAQYRFYARDQFEVAMTHPSEANRFWSARGGTSINFRIPPWHMADPDMATPLARFYWAMSEFWVFEEETPRFDFIPAAWTQSPRAHMTFSGILYYLQEQAAPSEGLHILRANGRPMTGAAAARR